MPRILGKCPACEHSQYELVKLRCRNCGTTVEGTFGLSRLGSLPAEHQDFIETFIKCRGNIKDVERELGISYPTVRGRLDRAIQALGFAELDVATRRKDILEALDRKELTPDEAIQALRELSDGEVANG
jgi:hypothetical protein